MIGWRDQFFSALGDLDLSAGDETFTPSRSIKFEPTLFDSPSRRVCPSGGGPFCRQTNTHLLEVIRYR